MSNKKSLTNEPEKFNYRTATLPEMQEHNKVRLAKLVQQGFMIPGMDYHYMCALLETLLGDNLETARKRYESTIGALIDAAEGEVSRAKLLQGVTLNPGQ